MVEETATELHMMLNEDGEKDTETIIIMFF